MPSQSLEVTVVIPTFNRSRLVLRALDSIRAQTVRPAAVIVVDDSSTDCTVEVVRQWSLENRFNIDIQILPTNSGAAAARNRGIQQSTTEYVAFLDSDDEYYPHTLAILIQPFQTTPKCVLSFADATAISPEGPHKSAFVRPNINIARDCEILAAKVTTQYRLLDAKSWLLDASKIPTSATCFRRDAALAVGGMPQEFRMGEDWIFWLRLSERGDFVFQLDDVVKHYRHDQNLTHPSSAAAIAQAKLHGFRALLDGHVGVDLSASQKSRVTALLSQQYASWRYHLSRLGLRRYIAELRAHIGRFGGTLSGHLTADPKCILRATYHSLLPLHSGEK
jgi:glycosyltransferase involved in cell wall biosynthesis